MNHEIRQYHALLANLNRLLEKSGEDELLKLNLRSRIEQTQAELAKLKHVDGSLFPREFQEPPRGAIFFEGGVVVDDGIPASFVGSAILEYASIFEELAIHEERKAAVKSGRKRRVRGSPSPSLIVTGTLKGSFGIEFSPVSNSGGSLPEFATTFENIAKLVARIANGDVEEAIKSTPRRVINPLKKFLRLVSSAGTDMRFAFDQSESVAFKTDDILKAADKLDARIAIEDEVVFGMPLGVTLETGHFDFQKDNGAVLSGYVSDELDDDDLLAIQERTRIRSRATIETTQITSPDGATRRSYVLRKVEDAEQSDSMNEPEKP